MLKWGYVHALFSNSNLSWIRYLDFHTHGGSSIEPACGGNGGPSKPLYARAGQVALACGKTLPWPSLRPTSYDGDDPMGMVQ